MSRGKVVLSTLSSCSICGQRYARLCSSLLHTQGSNPQDVAVRANVDSGHTGCSTTLNSGPFAAQVCSCNNVDKGTIFRSVTEGGLFTVKDVKTFTKVHPFAGVRTAAQLVRRRTWDVVASSVRQDQIPV